MSTHAVKVTRIRAIEPIPNADAIELAVVGDYRSVVPKGEFKVDELAVYIPEQSIVPAWVLERMGLVGKLAGREKNRVKAIKLRGCLSQGLLYKLHRVNREKSMLDFLNDGYVQPRMDMIAVWEGDNVSAYLGITKYEPAIPAYMSGDVYNAGTDLTVNFDVENIKAFPYVLVPGEDVIMTEKIHGTFCGVGILPEKDWSDKHYLRKFVVFSKSPGARGLCFTDSERNLGNVYFRALMKEDVFNKMERAFSGTTSPIFLLGEVYGRGVQDLAYGSNDVSFRVFDVVGGYRNEQSYWTPALAGSLLASFEIETVPVVYSGPFSREALEEHTNGYETVSGKNTNIREGVVVRPATEREHPELGRVILKSVSEKYLLRKNGTEYN